MTQLIADSMSRLLGAKAHLDYLCPVRPGFFLPGVVMFIIKLLIIWALLFPGLGFCLWFSNGMRGSYLAELKVGLMPYVAMTLLFVSVLSVSYAIF